MWGIMRGRPDPAIEKEKALKSSPFWSKSKRGTIELEFDFQELAHTHAAKHTVSRNGVSKTRV